MRLHVQIGLEDGEKPEDLKLTIKGRGKVHQLDHVHGACVVEGIPIGTTINAIVKAPKPKAPKKTTAAK